MVSSLFRVDISPMSELTISEPPQLGNAKHKVFADSYLRGNSGSQAARDASYSAGSAGVTAHKLLKRPDISAYIDYHRNRATENAGVEKSQITTELARLAFSNVADFTRLNADGDLEVDFTGATREQLSAVSSVKVKKRKVYDNKGNVVGQEHHSEFKLWDKIRAAELLGKDMGMFKEPEQKVVIDVADRLLNARNRLRALPRVVDNEAE